MYRRLSSGLYSSNCSVISNRDAEKIAKQDVFVGAPMGEARVSTKQCFVPLNGCTGRYTPGLHVAGIAQCNADSRRC